MIYSCLEIDKKENSINKKSAGIENEITRSMIMVCPGNKCTYLLVDSVLPSPACIQRGCDKLEWKGLDEVQKKEYITITRFMLISPIFFTISNTLGNVVNWNGGYSPSYDYVFVNCCYFPGEDNREAVNKDRGTSP